MLFEISFRKTWGAKPSSRFSEFPRSADRTYLVELRSGIRVGGAIEIELNERKDRVDDAMHATRAPRQIGVDIVRKSALCSGAPDRDQMPGKRLVIVGKILEKILPACARSDFQAGLYPLAAA